MASYIMNITKYGFTELFLRNSFYFFINMITISLAAFSAFVLAAVVSGRIIEYIFTSVSLYCAHFGILLFWRNITSAFLYGSPNYIRLNNSVEMQDIFSRYFSFSLFTALNSDLRLFSYSNFETDISKEELIKYFKVDYSRVIVVLLLSLAIITISYMLFRNKKAEHCEKPNKFLPATVLTSAVFSLSLASLIFIAGRSYVTVIAFFLFAFLISSLIYLIYDSGIRRIKKNSLIFTVEALTSAAFMVCLFTGGFGYASKVPDVNSIKSVKITYKGDPQNVNNLGSGSYGGLLNTYKSGPEVMISLTSISSIEKVTEIHKEIIKEGCSEVTYTDADPYSDTKVFVDVYIEYEGKDGQKTIRFYPIMKLSTLSKLLYFDETDEYREYYIKKCSDEYYYSTNHFSVSDPLLTNITEFDLELCDEKELMSMICFDKSKETVQRRYYPEKNCIAIIILSRYNMLDRYSSFSFNSDYYYIYDDDESVISWLKSKGYDKYYKLPYQIKSVELYRIPAFIYNKNDNYNNYNNYQKQSAASRCFKSKYDIDMTNLLSLTKTANPEEFDEIIAASRSMYYMDVPGYAVLIKTVSADGEERTVTKFMPINEK
ncbi:hypothetical protein SDC9_87531 [bioreactor metagenome]|uniref:Uncharacterized protein n=1 Tax=bioreactor metagenome TaxID=1076179 RepID=A0A644ZQG6_9ZZZZ